MGPRRRRTAKIDDGRTSEINDGRTLAMQGACGLFVRPDITGSAAAGSWWLCSLQDVAHVRSTSKWALEMFKPRFLESLVWAFGGGFKLTQAQDQFVVCLEAVQGHWRASSTAFHNEGLNNGKIRVENAKVFLPQWATNFASPEIVTIQTSSDGEIRGLARASAPRARAHTWKLRGIRRGRQQGIDYDAGPLIKLSWTRVHPGGFQEVWVWERLIDVTPNLIGTLAALDAALTLAEMMLKDKYVHVRGTAARALLLITRTELLGSQASKKLAPLLAEAALLRRGITEDEDDAHLPAADALLELGPDAASALQVLRDALDDPGQRGEPIKILTRLGQVSNPVALPLLKLAIWHDDELVRCQARNALGVLGLVSGTAMDEIQKALTDECQERRELAARAVGRMHMTEEHVALIVPTLTAAVLSFEEYKDGFPESSFAMGALNDLDGTGYVATRCFARVLSTSHVPAQREKALRALGSLHELDSSAAGEIAKVALDGIDSEAQLARHALSTCRDAVALALPEAILALQGTCRARCSAAVELLGAVGELAGQAVPALVDAFFKHCEDAVLSKRVLELLVDMLSIREADFLVAPHAVRALQEESAPRRLAALRLIRGLAGITCTFNTAVSAREAALLALPALAGAFVKYCEDATFATSCLELIDRRLGPAVGYAVPHARALLQEESVTKRLAAVELLNSIRKNNAMAAATALPSLAEAIIKHCDEAAFTTVAIAVFQKFGPATFIALPTLTCALHREESRAAHIKALILLGNLPVAESSSVVAEALLATATRWSGESDVVDEVVGILAELDNSASHRPGATYGLGMAPTKRHPSPRHGTDLASHPSPGHGTYLAPPLAEPSLRFGRGEGSVRGVASLVLCLGDRWGQVGAVSRRGVDGQVGAMPRRGVSPGAMPVIAGLCPHGDFGEEQAKLLREADAAMKRLGVPVLDWLHVLSKSGESFGTWCDELSHGAEHPNSSGHRRMFSAVDLTLFEPAKVTGLLSKRAEGMKADKDVLFSDGNGFEMSYSVVREELTLSNTTSAPYEINPSWDELRNALEEWFRASPWSLRRGLYVRAGLKQSEGEPLSVYIGLGGRLESQASVPAGCSVTLSHSSQLPGCLHESKKVIFQDGPLLMFQEDNSIVLCNEADCEYNVHPMWAAVRQALKSMGRGVWEDGSGMPFRTAVISAHGLQSRVKVPGKSMVQLRRSGDLSSLKMIAVLPLGDRCSIRMLLHKIEYDGPCYPFDLTRTTSLADVADMVATGFTDMWNEEQLFYDHEAGRVFHRRWGGLSFAHEVDEGDDPVGNFHA
ncbi:unnamed protein product, partial [Polarella glacialis]